MIVVVSIVDALACVVRSDGEHTLYNHVFSPNSGSLQWPRSSFDSHPVTIHGCQLCFICYKVYLLNTLCGKRELLRLSGGHHDGGEGQ